MDKFLSGFFGLSSRSTSVKSELIAGAMTFVAMSWIIFIVPSILRHAGMPYGAAVTAVCVATGAMCIIMGLVGNFPVAASPLISASLFFAFTLVAALGFSWQQAAMIVLIEGAVYFLLTVTKFRDYVSTSIPASLKYAVAAGTGIFMVLLGLKWAGIIVPDADTFFHLGRLKSPAVIVALAGILAAAVLFVRRVKGSLIIAALITLVIAMIAGVMALKSVVSVPVSVKSLFLKFDAPSQKMLIDAIFAGVLLLLLHTFEALGNAVSPKNQGAMKVLIVDALGTPAGACLGLPNVSSSMEANPGGIAASGKSGLSAVVAGLLFLAAMFLYPVFKLLGGGVAATKALTLYPVAAPVLVLLGFLALQKLLKINFNDLSDSLPACVTLLVIPFTFNIATGLAFGIITYTVIRMVQGKFKEISPLMYILAGLLLAYYIFF